MTDAHPLSQRLAAEFFGTFWLVFGGCGAAVLASGVPGVGIGYLGVAVAFGLTVLTMAYAVGHVSGGHFNPAISLGLATAKRFDWRDVPAYVVTQVVAAVAASTVLFVVANGAAGFSAKKSGFATNGYGDRSPGGYSLLAVIVVEVVLTAFFLYVILGATDTRAPKGFAPLAIGSR
jgi:aquaporin Z